MKNKQKASSDKFTMMTQMPVNKLICKMAVPTIITMLVSAVYNMADTYFVGKIGTSATGAVGVVFSFMAIIQACGFFFGHGSGNYMSRKLGEQKTEEASVMASTGFFSSVMRSITLCTRTEVLPEPAAAATKTVPPVEEMAFFWSSVQLLAMLIFTSFHFFNCFFVGHRSNFFEIIFFIAANRMIFAKFA